MAKCLLVSSVGNVYGNVKRRIVRLFNERNELDDGRDAYRCMEIGMLVIETRDILRVWKHDELYSNI